MIDAVQQHRLRPRSCLCKLGDRSPAALDDPLGQYAVPRQVQKDAHFAHQRNLGMTIWVVAGTAVLRTTGALRMIHFIVFTGRVEIVWVYWITVHGYENLLRSAHIANARSELPRHAAAQHGGAGAAGGPFWVLTKAYRKIHVTTMWSSMCIPDSLISRCACCLGKRF